MTPRLWEFRAMLDAGSRYLAGQCSIIELHGHAQNCKTIAKFIHAHPAISNAADEWVTMACRRWNEFNDAQDPLTEASFRAWLESELLNYE